jgi:hypothetical protein
MDLKILDPQQKCVHGEIGKEIYDEKRSQVMVGDLLFVCNFHPLMPIRCKKIQEDINEEKDIDKIDDCRSEPKYHMLKSQLEGDQDTGDENQEEDEKIPRNPKC